MSEAPCEACRVFFRKTKNIIALGLVPLRPGRRARKLMHSASTLKWHSVASSLATKTATPDLDRAPEPGEDWDPDLVRVLGPVGPKHPTADPDPDPPRTPEPYQDVVGFLVAILWSDVTSVSDLI